MRVARHFSLPLLAICLLALLAAGCGPDYGQRLEFNKGDLFYTDKVTKAEAQRLGEYLTKLGIYDGKEKSLQLSKEGDHYQVRVVIKEESRKKESVRKAWRQIIYLLSSHVFEGAPVEGHFCDKYFKTLSKITMGPSWGRVLSLKGGRLYYRPGVSKELAHKFGRQLVSEGFFDGKPKDAMLEKAGPRYQWRIVAKKGWQDNHSWIMALQNALPRISSQVFDGAPLDALLCDAYFQPLRKLTMGPGLGRVLKFKGASLYYTKPAGEKAAGRLGQLLVKWGFFSGRPMKTQLDKKGTVWIFRIITKPGLENNPRTVAVLTRFAGNISKRAFQGAPLELHMCDRSFKTLRVLRAAAPPARAPAPPSRPAQAPRSGSGQLPAQLPGSGLSEDMISR